MSLPPNVHMRNSEILLSNAMAAEAVKKIYTVTIEFEIKFEGPVTLFRKLI
jgi:hypothetical protein